MWDHNGTYMDGIGFQYREHRVVVEISPEDTLSGADHLTPTTIVF
jgi:hypothetical protein